MTLLNCLSFVRWQLEFKTPALVEGGDNRGGVHTGQFLIEGDTNRRGCLCELVLNKKWVLIEGGMHVGSFSIE